MRIESAKAADRRDHRGTRQYAPCLLVGAAYLFAGVRFFLLISRYSVDILGWDQWDFDDATLFQHHTLWEMFRWQHGPHRQGLGAWFQRLIDPPIHWNPHFEALVLGIIVLIAAVLALLLKQRLYGRIEYLDVVIPLLFFTPLQYESFIAAPNPAQGPLPLLLIVLYGFCWRIQSRRLRYPCILVANFLLTYTGYGVFMGFVTPALLTIDWVRVGHSASKHWLGAAWVALSLASLASYFVGYKFQPDVNCFSSTTHNPADYLRFVGILYAHTGRLSIPSLSLAAFVGLMVLAWFATAIVLVAKRLGSSGSETWPRDAAMLAFLAYSVAFCLSAAYGRLCLGVRAAASSRYTEWVVVGYFGLYLSSLSLSSRSRRRVLVSTLLILSLLGERRLSHVDTGFLEAVSSGKRAWRDCYLVRHNIQECNATTNFEIYFPGRDTRLQEKLDFLERNHLNLFDGSH